MRYTASAEGVGGRFYRVFGAYLPPKLLPFTEDAMSNLHGSMVVLGDQLVQGMVDLGVSRESVGHWQRSYVRCLDRAEEKGVKWETSAEMILRHLMSAQRLVEAARLVRDGN